MRLGIRAALLGLLFGAGALSVGCGDDDDSGGSPTDVGGAADGGAANGADGGMDAAPTSGAGDQPGSSAGAGGVAGPEPLTFIDRLDQLGAKTDLPTEPIDAKGKPLPDGYHPLKKPFATLRPHQEIYFAGPQFGGQREGVLDDGYDGKFAQLLPKPLQTAWLANGYRAAVAADVNGDGIQEFVVVYYDAASKQLKGKVVWGPNGKDAAHETETVKLADITQPSNAPEDYFQFAVTAANIDDDPAEELFVGFQDLFVFDDLDHNLAQLKRDTLGSMKISVCRGDFDAKLADPVDEVMVMWNAPVGDALHYQVFDGLTPSFDATGRIMRPTLNDSAHTEDDFHQGFCMAGELDGDDPAQEIALLAGDTDNWRLMIIDDANASFRTFDSFRPTLYEGDNSVLALADIDGDGIDEVAAEHYIFDGLEKLPSSSDKEVTNDLEQSKLVTRTHYGLGTSYQMRGGRVAPDYAAPPNENVEQFVAIDNGGRLVYSARNPTKNNEFTWVDLGPSPGAFKGDLLALGNVDFDSPVVRYTGEHELLYSNPELLVGMAAPPFYAGTNQEESSSTSFGRGTANSVEHESSVGFSVGFSIGYESEDPLGIASSSFKVSVNQSFDSLAQNGSTVSEFVTYTGGPEDSVVFTVVPFDVYYYEVVSAPDLSQVGNTLSVNLPRQPQTLLATSEYFDQFVDEARKSAPLFSTHRVGEPFSYSGVAERDTLCGGHCFKSSKALPIGQGSGSTTIEISKAESQGVGASYSLSVDVESEASLGGVSVGSSVGFSYGFSMTTTTEETTVFTGQLGSLKDLTPENGYRAGIFAHQHIHPTSIKPILMVDYWVER